MSPRVINQIVNFIFDNLILLIFFASVIIPIFRRAGKNRQKTVTKTNQPLSRQPSRQVLSKPTEASTGEFQKRLEEARRRVQEAMGEQAQPQAQQQPAKPKPASAIPTLLTEMHDPGLLSDQSFKEHNLSGDDIRSDHPLMRADHASSFLPPESATSSSLFTGTSSSFFAQEQAPLKVVRRNQKSSKLKSSKMLEFDEEAITKGLIWHYILSEPNARKRRKLFPHQS